MAEPPAAGAEASAPDTRLGPLGAAEQSAAVDLLARAFRDNPLNAMVLAGRSPEARRRSNAHGMRALLPAAAGHGTVLAGRLEGRLAGVLIAAPPYAYPFPLAPLGARLWSALGQGWRVALRWRDVFNALDAVHPSEGHWYLGTLGVHPELQGRGIGSAMLRHWLARVDADAERAYLETDRHENVSFYERAGFRVAREIEVLGVPVWLMERDRAPRPGA